MYHRCLLEAVFLHSLPPVPAFPWPENDFTRSIFFIVARFRRNAKDFLRFRRFPPLFCGFLRKIAEVFLPLSPFFPEKGDGEFVNDA